MTLASFMKKFVYVPERAGYIGIEREAFIADCRGQIIAAAPRVLAPLAGGNEEFGYELSACQIETRIGPVVIDAVSDALTENDAHLNGLLGAHGLTPLHAEVGPEDMPLDVYPDPTGRYAALTRDMPRDVLLSACRVIGTHIHVGMPSHGIALLVYNHIVTHTPRLCGMGDGSEGARLAIYRQMAPESDPMPYASWRAFYAAAQAQGFAEDPRKCWTFVRISVHGTLEFRMFGATDSLLKIESWTRECHGLCMDALEHI